MGQFQSHLTSIFSNQEIDVQVISTVAHIMITVGTFFKIMLNLQTLSI